MGMSLLLFFPSKFKLSMYKCMGVKELCPSRLLSSTLLWLTDSRHHKPVLIIPCMLTHFKAKVERWLYLEFLDDFRKDHIVSFYEHIWNHYRKLTKMNTNKPMGSPVVLEIALYDVFLKWHLAIDIHSYREDCHVAMHVNRVNGKKCCVF